MTTERERNISRIKINLGTRKVTIKIPDHLQRHDKIHLSHISAEKLYQIRLTFQFLTGLDVETRATIYPTTKKSQLPTKVASQTWFDSLQQTMKLMNCRDYALQTTEVSEFNY